MNRKLLLVVVAFFTQQNSFSQAFRINYFGLMNSLVTTESDITPQPYLGLGYEQNLGHKIALSLEYNVSYSTALDDESLVSEETQYASVPSGNGTYSYSYTFEHPMQEISYQSKYLFRETGTHSWYVSTGLSLLMVDYTWKLNSSNQWNAQPPADYRASSFNETVMYVPFNLRFGFRGPIDGSYGDYSFGLKVNLSGDKVPKNATYKYVSNKSSITDVAFFLCASWGFGWAKKKQ